MADRTATATGARATCPPSVILATSPAGARTLFEDVGGDVTSGFRTLAKRWHPDVNKTDGATEVFEHLVALKAAADRASGGAEPTVRTFVDVDGRPFEMRHLSARTVEVGELLVGRTSVAYVVSPDLADLAAAASGWTPTFAGPAMRSEMERFLPARILDRDTAAGRVMAYARTPDQVLLADLIPHMGGRLDAVHAAWIVSGLLNLCCWLEWAGWSSGWIAPETLLVSPLHHSVALTGPALFTTATGRRPVALPSRTLDVVPRAGLPDQVASAATDLELVRATVREVLGDPAGARLLSGPAVPAAFATWLCTPPAATAREDYAGWERARERAFGTRRFVELKVTSADVYGG